MESSLIFDGGAACGSAPYQAIGKKLWEMRLQGKEGIARAIYLAASDRRLVIIRIFVKKTWKTPRREIN